MGIQTWSGISAVGGQATTNTKSPTKLVLRSGLELGTMRMETLEMGRAGIKL